MRINVYAEEIAGEVVIVTNGKFSGLRFYLKTHTDLHHSPEVDDRTAITLWGLPAVTPLINAAARLLIAEPRTPPFPSGTPFPKFEDMGK
jgi:hypothetical protein